MRSALEGVAGVQSVQIDNSAKTATVSFSADSDVTPASLVKIFEGTKFSAKVKS